MLLQQFKVNDTGTRRAPLGPQPTAPAQPSARSLESLTIAVDFDDSPARCTEGRHLGGTGYLDHAEDSFDVVVPPPGPAPEPVGQLDGPNPADRPVWS
jgi:hypothetical protein